jgi:predicted DNA-binding transcriptional regulator
MITDTKIKILGYIGTHKQARAHDLVRVFGISQVAVHKQLKKLLEEGKIRRVGKPPLVFYILPATKKAETSMEVSTEVRKVIDDNYLYISPVGELLYGFEGFAAWVRGIKEEAKMTQLAEEYIKTLGQFKSYRNSDGYINATEKAKSTFEDTAVDTLLYGDFYSIPKFGKTKFGQLVLYAKQSQNRDLISELAILVKPTIEVIIQKFSIDAVAFIPPTVPRALQFMDEFEKALNLKIPSIELVKVTSGEVTVAQKTLSRLDERIANARDTIFLKSNENSYPNVLLIDDAVGSGATLNETAKKFKGIMVGKKSIIAFAIVGSFKGFDVIREV